jgi:uncharacterized protein YwbE
VVGSDSESRSAQGLVLGVLKLLVLLQEHHTGKKTRGKIRELLWIK